MGVFYCTREDVKSALDSAETARNNRQVDRAIEAASRGIERLTLRKFYPQLATRYFDWPDLSGSRPWRLWLDDNELISVTTLTAAATVIAAADFFLEPANSGPPYSRVEIDLASSAAFSAGDTHQRAIAILGEYGYRADTERVGTLTAQLAADLNATASISWDTAQIGVGDMLKIDNEWMTVSARSMVDTSQNLGGNLTASMSDVTVAVSNGTAFAADAVLLIGSERMLVVDVVGNNLTVKRAWDGTVLAAHTSGVDVFTLTGVAITRAQLGTTLAVHANAAVVYRLQVPGPVRDLCVAEAINQVQQETSGYGRTVGAGENEKDAAGAGLEGLRAKVRTDYGRGRARVRAV